MNMSCKKGTLECLVRAAVHHAASGCLIRMVAFASLAAMITVLSGCGKPESQPSGQADVIKIGEIVSLTGKEATYGVSSHNATLMAVDELNAAGGLLGRKVQLISDDDQSKAGEAATVAHKLISRDKVIAILGEVVSSRSLEAAPICQQFKIPMVSPASTNPKVTEVGDRIFRVCFTDLFQGAVIADFASKNLKVTKAAVLTDLKSDYSKGLAQCFKERFVKNGGQVIAEPNYSGGDKDFKAQLTAIKAAGPDVVVIPGYYTDVGLIALQAEQLGMKVPMLGGDGWESPKLLELGGAALEGHFFSTHYSPDKDSPMVKNFVKSYQERFKQVPDALAALGYDSALILFDAIKRAGSLESDKIRDALAATQGFEAVTGKISMDAQRNPTKPAVILTIKGGQFKYVDSVTP